MTDQPVDQSPEPFKCPHCSGELDFTFVTKLMSNSQMSFTLTPHKGEMLRAATVGAAIENLDKLLTATGDDLGVKTQVLVNGLTYSGGSVAVDLLIARHETGVVSREAPK